MAQLDRRSARRDEGFTLIEMLVVVTLVGIVGALVSSIMISSMHTARWQEDKTRSLISAKMAMERVTREIRGANSVDRTPGAVTPRSLTVITTAGTVRREVTIAVVDTARGTELRQTVKRTDSADGGATDTETTILGGLEIGKSEAVFTYTDGVGTPLTPATTSPVTYDASHVNTVGVRIVLKRDTGTQPTELYQLVSLRNLEG